MKKYILSICLLFPLFIWATDYYVATEGSDGNTGTSSGSPISTLTKVNSIAFVAGDHIFFKRGETWYGTLNVRSGSSGNPIIYAAYGVGTNPIITGFQDIGPWTNIATNLWRSTNAIGALSSCNMVLVNNTFTAIGKWPNGNKVYNTITSFSTRTSLTSSSISGAINYVGATVVYRPEHWILDKAPITSQSGSTISFTPPNPNYSNKLGWGFFIQNSQVVCDVQNEWWYESSTKKLGIFSTSSPINIKAVTLDYILNIGTNSFVTINSLIFSGSNSNTINITSGNNIRFDSCSFLYAGINGFTPSPAAHHITITNCYSDYTNNDFINGSGSANWNITNNTFRRTAMIAGMGNSSDGQYIAMYNMGANSLIQYNRVVQTGYNGIDFRGSSNVVSNNLVDTFCNVKDDGAGIYTYTGPTTTVWTQRTVDHNIIMNGFGASAGTNTANSDASGIYMDGNSSQVTITNNTIYNCGQSGIFLNADHDLIVQNNTFYNNATTGGYGQLLHIYPTVNFAEVPKNITITGNKFISKATNQIVAYLKLTSVPLSTLGTWDNNYYCRPANENTSTFSIITTGTTVTNLTGWKSFSGKDASSQISPVTITDLTKFRFEYNATNSAVAISLSGNNYTDVTGAGFSGTLNLAPWTSAVLIQTAGTGNVLPTVDAGGPFNLLLPTNSAVMSPTYGDADGTVTGFNWTYVSGPTTYLISNPNIAAPTISGLTTGNYVFQLKVTDNASGFSTDLVSINVTSSTSNIPPTSNAGADIGITLPVTTTHLSGSGSDADGSISAYHWTLESGPVAATVVTPNSNETDITGLAAAGQYRFRLTITDNNGAIGTDDIIVNVQLQLPGNKFQFLKFGYHPIASGDSLLWNVSGDNAIIRYEIERSSDTTANTSWARIGTSNYTQLYYFDPFPQTTICIKKWWWICTQKKTIYTVTHYYYRIKAIDNNANIIYSPIIKT